MGRCNWGVRYIIQIILVSIYQRHCRRLQYEQGSRGTGLLIGLLLLGSVLKLFIERIVLLNTVWGVDRHLGILFGGARGILLIVLLVAGVSYTRFQEQEIWKNSYLVPEFQKIETQVRAYWAQFFED